MTQKKLLPQQQQYQPVVLFYTPMNNHNIPNNNYTQMNYLPTPSNSNNIYNNINNNSRQYSMPYQQQPQQQNFYNTPHQSFSQPQTFPITYTYTSPPIQQTRPNILPSFQNLLQNVDKGSIPTSQYTFTNNYTYKLPKFIESPPLQQAETNNDIDVPMMLSPEKNVKPKRKRPKRTPKGKIAKPKVECPVTIPIRTRRKRRTRKPQPPVVKSEYPLSLHNILNVNNSNLLDEVKRCYQCDESETPEWRLGPYGTRSLCNACGLYYRRLIQRFNVKHANLIMRFNKFNNPQYVKTLRSRDVDDDDDNKDGKQKDNVTINQNKPKNIPIPSTFRQVPNKIDIPQSIIHQLDNDPNLDSNYNTIFK